MATPYMIGDHRPDGSQMNGTLGTSASPRALTYDGDKALEMFNTCASTNAATSFEPVKINTVMTGAGQVGGRVRINLESNVALGGWVNAFKASMDYKTSGSNSGLGSAICCEMALPASDTALGTYAALELELTAAASCDMTHAPTMFLYANLSGDATACATVNDTGYLMRFDGLGSATSATNIFHTTGTVSATHGLRISVGGVDYDILLKASTYA